MKRPIQKTNELCEKNMEEKEVNDDAMTIVTLSFTRNNE